MLALQQLSCLLECFADPPAIRIDDGKERLDRFLLGFDVELDIAARAAAAVGPCRCWSRGVLRFRFGCLTAAEASCLPCPLGHLGSRAWLGSRLRREVCRIEGVEFIAKAQGGAFFRAHQAASLAAAALSRAITSPANSRAFWIALSTLLTCDGLSPASVPP